MNKLLPFALSLPFALTSVVQAEDFRQHDAHVHGQVEINIAQDGNEVLFEITAPGADVVGFEHAAKNEQQKHKIEEAVSQLNHESNIFTLASAANCTIEHKSVTHTLNEDSHDEHKHHDHEEHDHHETHKDHDHDHEEHNGHDHHDEHKEGGHGEFTIEYHYLCESVAKLNSIETQWFTHFPSTESIRVNILTDTKQAALDLSKGQSKITL